MAKCSIQIELDNSRRTYAPREFITGTVVVNVLEPCRCEQLTLGWQWRARGGSILDEAHPEHLLTLNEGEEWLAGQELRYPFRLEAPVLPLTYHGHLMSVDWALRADASLSRFLDPPYRAEKPFHLVLAETRQPAPAATGPGPDSSHVLEVKAAPDEEPLGYLFRGWLFMLGFFALFFSFGLRGMDSFMPVFPLIAIGWILLSRWRKRRPAWNHAMGRLWLDPAIVPPGGSTRLHIQLRPQKRLREHDLSVSAECAELVTSKGEDGTLLQEKVVHTEPLLTCTNRALNAGEFLEIPHVTLAIRANAPTSFKFRTHELRWRLRLVLRRKGDKRTFFQLVPFQVHPPLPMSRAPTTPHQAFQVSSSLPANPAPWIQVAPAHEERRRPLPSSDAIRRQLEGGLEVLEAAHAHYTTLEEALRAPKWKLHLRSRLETLREAIRQEPALIEALERLHHRARSEGWAGTEPALVLAQEVKGLRARVGALASRQLGPPEERETGLARRLDRLERSVLQSIPTPLAPGEKLLCSGGFSPSLFLPGVLLLLGLSWMPGSRVWWGTWLLLTALCFWLQYRRSGRYWLTERRLIWLPMRGEPLQVSPLDIRDPSGSGFRYPKSVKVLLEDGHFLLLAFISRAGLLEDALWRQCQALRDKSTSDNERSSLPEVPEERPGTDSPAP
ncbi:MAG TPA: hypothetical protein VFZ09_45445 [Archangium sp.]|uniref:hypothetical protein n=1 Tax=Archangium sp. TaxID=1872627 RepID=UPI002E366E60|nr:hypothetical protein [Archangium sp.]HEX5753528.1 hypothetical protein [Archangium sp.]